MSKILARANDDQVKNRENLIRLFNERPMPDDQLMVNFGMYIRSSVLAKIFYMNELYEQIVMIPGVVMEFGVWWGQNMSLFESFRAMYEPYNYLRKIVGFDTFTGYPKPGNKDGDNDYAVEGSWSVTENYKEYLSELLDYHEKENVNNSHMTKYELVEGDMRITLPEYLSSNPETIVALAFIDLGFYETTKICLEALKPHLVKGSIIGLDELNCPEYPGETVALREVFGLDNYRIVRSKYLPDRSYMVIE
jgi:hypothetical protein